MPTLTNYNQFNGRHWETGTIHNYYAHRQITAPHTNQPYSEALLMGISGGLVFGYFNFAYDGHDPQCNILTRNTFDPWDTLLSRLGVNQNIHHSLKTDRAINKLTDLLDSGLPVIAWPDHWSLTYNGHENSDMWGALPIIVYGYEPDQDTVHIADRATVPLSATTTEFHTALGRLKKYKNRLITLDPPNPDKLTTAIRLGLSDTIKLFTEKPPKGSANNFGLNAYQFWAKMLTNPKQRKSWHKFYPHGPRLYAGLTTAYEFACLFGKNDAQDGERTLYATFLDEAATLLNQPRLHDAANQFRTSATLWQQLPNYLLPRDIPPFQQARDLLYQRHLTFLNHGNAGLPTIHHINHQLNQLRQQIETNFPLTPAQTDELKTALADHILRLHDAEKAAITTLQQAI
ncbi:MAG TPA: BtrH N-terminal domain-containing protein [Anaerolineae bacterium]|nr:BtrH N-terminal domain-containing protein [Anaerolineae bacterium]